MICRMVSVVVMVSVVSLPSSSVVVTVSSCSMVSNLLVDFVYVPKDVPGFPPLYRRGGNLHAVFRIGSYLDRIDRQDFRHWLAEMLSLPDSSRVSWGFSSCIRWISAANSPLSRLTTSVMTGVFPSKLSLE